MKDKNNKISSILKKYKSSFSKQDLLNLETLLSNNLEPNETYFLYTDGCLLYTSPSPRDQLGSRMPSSA